MEIILNKEIGFCFGVKRAEEIALKARKETNKSCQVLGPLVHNEKVIKKLEEAGIEFINLVEDVKDGTVIIAAHGARPEVFKKLEKKKVKIIDATCPLVSKVHDIVKNFLNKDYQIFIFGDKGHTEVEGILGAAEDRAIVIENLEDVFGLEVDDKRKVVLVSQTTQEKKEVEKILMVLKKKFREVKFFDTICRIVSSYQKGVKELAEKVEIILIVGSKTSANTKRLKKVVDCEGKRNYYIKESNDLQREWFFGIEKVGIASGTSVPMWQIEEIIEKIKIFQEK